MKQFVISMVVAVFAFAGFVPDAEARRFGGGGSSGMQRQALPPSQPRPPAAAPQRQTPPPAAAAQPAGRSWMGPVAGLAAGLGLAALFSHLGLGEELASFLLIALLIFAAVMVFRMFARRSSSHAALAAQGSPAGGNAMQFGGAASSSAHGHSAPTQFHQPMSASASVAPAVSSRHPEFDAEGFARQAKLNFIRLQAAHDEGNLDDIREFTTPEMFAEIRLQMSESHTHGQRTDVIELNAEVIDVEEEDARYIVSVRFNGLLREEANAEPASFDEVWHLTKSKTADRGWLIAGIQQVS